MTERDPENVEQRYDQIAQQYRKSIELPLRVYVDRPNLLSLAGPLKGKTVLDLACGEGHYTRLLKQAGAAEVLGIDLSHEMIALAEATERREPIGCRYQTGDAADLALDRGFDLVVAVYLLHYARTKPQLLSFCRTIRRHLAPGGRFVGLNLDMMFDPAHYASRKPYGIWFSGPTNPKEGDPVTVHIANQDGSTASFDNYYLKPETYAQAFAEAGLEDLTWHKLQVSEDGLAAFPPGYWDATLAHPMTVGMRARLGP